MRPDGILRRLPRGLRNHILHFEASIDGAVRDFSRSIPKGSLVLDAGAGESQHAPAFRDHRYVAVDLGVGDRDWSYDELDAIADLAHLPFAAGCFDGCINIVTLEHVPEPACVLREISRILKPGGRVLMIVPHEWEVHQTPHDYYRYTRYGMHYLLERAGFRSIRVLPVGGYFRLLARRLLNGLQFFRGVWFIPAAMLLAPPALLLPLLDGLDKERNFTLGYICTAEK